MAIEFTLPGLGENIATGDIIGVLVKEGDVLTANQDVVEVEAGKGTFPIPCPHAGRVAKVHVRAGQSVPVGALLLTVEAVEAAPRAARPSAPAPAAQPPVAHPPVAPAPAKAPAIPVAPEPAPAAPLVAVAAASPTGGAAPIAAGPAMRRLARELGVDLQRVTGTGPEGRITRADIVASVRQSTAAAPARTSSIEGAGSRDSYGVVRRQPLTRIRKTIAQNMAISSSTIPHVTNFDDADITELERIRKGSMADYVGSEVKITMMSFVMKAVAQSLRLHPLLNASLDLDEGVTIYKEYINLGVAVDTERGLVVPVVRDVDRLTIPQIAQALGELATKAKSNQFTLDELRGGTFTISNLGAIGGTYSTPIINPPEVAVLLIGRSRTLPVCLEDKIVPRLLMPLSLSYDHRLIDGAVAARFLNELKNYLQVPGRLLLAT